MLKWKPVRRAGFCALPGDSARPVGRFPALWPWCGFRPLWLPAGSRFRGAFACRPLVVAAVFAPFPVVSRCPFRLRRRFLSVAVALPVRLPPGLPFRVRCLGSSGGGAFLAPGCRRDGGGGFFRLSAACAA